MWVCDGRIQAMSRVVVYESDRLFSVFGYSMSHGLLLLRSGKSNTARTRVDILFQDVRAMEIRAWLAGIQIEELNDPTFLENQRSKPLETIEPGLKVFSVSCPERRNPIEDATLGWQGFIVSGSVRIAEDQGEMFGPSSLVSEPPGNRWSLG
jgi:hypothetical protein